MIKRILKKFIKPDKKTIQKEHKEYIQATQTLNRPEEEQPKFGLFYTFDEQKKEQESTAKAVSDKHNESQSEKETVYPQEIKIQTADERLASLRNKVITIIIGVVGLMFLGYSLKDMIIPVFHKKTQEEQKQKAKLIEAPKDAKRGEIVNPQALEQDWKTLIEKRISEQDKALTDITKKLDDISTKLEKKEKEKVELEKEKKSAKESMPAVPPPPLPGNAGMSIKAEPQVQPVFKSIDFKKNNKDNKQLSSPDTSKTDNINLPMGIAVGLTFTGMDAPTFQWGQQEPQPMLISLESALVTAGGKEIDLKNCMALASGYGAVSSEKAMLRLISMQCRDKKGNLYAGSVEGWVLGDDGKVGVTGRLVSRQGSVIAKSFWADVLSLGGSALRATATTTAVSPLGSLETTTKDSDIWKSAAGQAVERTTGRIAQFFIKIAEQIYPVIEVQPGRKVTVLIKHGVLKRVTQDNFYDIVASQMSQTQQAKQDTKEEKK
ncbi:TraB/VirB10 family protein [Thermodesulfovibrio sp. TK110]